MYVDVQKSKRRCRLVRWFRKGGKERGREKDDFVYADIKKSRRLTKNGVLKKKNSKGQNETEDKRKCVIFFFFISSPWLSRGCFFFGQVQSLFQTLSSCSKFSFNQTPMALTGKDLASLEKLVHCAQTRIQT
jgi:hypothetical protein